MTPLLAALLTLLQADDVPSGLWGRQGEAWTPQGRLPDYSWAGYRLGARPLPDAAVRSSVRDFGAKGDGQADDTAAFRRALEQAPEGALLVPAGRYLISDLLVLGRSRIVLRGEGPEKTFLVFPKTLSDVKPDWGATTTGQRTSNYSWGGGFLTLRGTDGGRALGRIEAPAARGERRLKIAEGSGLKPGDLIEIRQSDEDGSLVSHLYAGRPGDTSKLRTVRTSFVSPVESVEGTLLTLARPLRTDVDPRWKAELRSFEPDVTESGVEELAFEFPVAPYGGHFSELGWNPLAFQRVAHCWGRKLRVINGDSGPYLGGKFCTLQGIVLESARPPDRTGLTGHHGITAYGDDNLVEDFEIRHKYVHDLTVEHSAGNVFRRGRAADLSMDHHKKAPHANLFTDLDLGVGSRPFRSGGGAALGLHSGAWGTFWNLRARKPLEPPPSGFGPDALNFVAFGPPGAAKAPGGVWWEPLPPERLVPADLYLAQRERRLRAK